MSLFLVVIFSYTTPAQAFNPFSYLIDTLSSWFSPQSEVVIPTVPVTPPPPIVRVANPVTVIGPAGAPGLQGTQGSQGPMGLAGPQGPRGLQGPQGVAGSNIDTSAFVSRTLFDNQVSRILDSIDNSVQGLSDSLAKLVDTDALTVSGNATVGGDLTITGAGSFTGALTAGTFNGLTITANGTNTLDIAAGKSLVVSNILTLTGTDSTTMTFPTTSATIARTDMGQIFTGNQTIANLIGNKIYPVSDSTTALQFNKADGITNIFNVDTTNGYVGIGTTSPLAKLDVNGDANIGSSDEGQAMYVMSAFQGDGHVGPRDLVILTSNDGKTFNQISTRAVYTPTPPEYVRDPSITYYNNNYYVAYTNNDAFTSTSTGVGLITSPDLINWTKMSDIQVFSPGTPNTDAWAPNWFTDNGVTGIVLSAGTVGAKQPYWVPATNSSLTSWGTSVQITGDFPSNLEDVFIIKKDGTYYLWFSESSANALELATSSSPFSGYTVIRTGDWSVFGANSANSESIVKISPTDYRIYWRNYAIGKYYYSDSSDLLTWSTPVEINHPLPSAILQHGTVIRTSSVNVARNVSNAFNTVGSIWGENASSNQVYLWNGGLKSGLVGIGTTNPTANLQVAQGTAGVGTVTVSGTAVTGVGTRFTNTFKVGDTIIVTTTSGSETKAITTITSDTVLVTAAFAGTATGVAYTLVGGDRFAVLGNGNVGIGTTNPLGKLNILGNSNQVTIFRSDTGSYPYVESASNVFAKQTQDDTSAGLNNIKVVTRANTQKSSSDKALGLSVIVFKGDDNSTNWTNSDAFVAGIFSNSIDSTSTITGATSVRATVNSGNGVFTTYKAFETWPPTIGSGSIGTFYGLYLSSLNGLAITNKYGIYQQGTSTINYFAGNVGIGTTTPTANFQITQGTAGLGTVSTPGNSTTLTGVGTQFTNTFKIGDTLTVAGETVRTINTITSNTVLDVTAAFSATPRSSVAYTLTSGTRFSVLGNGNVGIGTTAPTGNLAITQTATATGALKGIVYTGAVNTNQTLNTEIPSLTLTTAGRQWATSTTLTTQREVLITQPLYSFVGASTITNAATVGIAGAPIAGTSATLTNSHGLLIQAGAVASGTTNSYGLTVNAQTGAGSNYTAAFLGGNVGIGIAIPTNILHVTGTPATGTHTARIANTLSGTATQNNGLLILAGNNGGTNAAQMITFQRPDATVIGSISQDTASTVAYNLSSDRRIKENITPTTFGLSDLEKINVSDFNFISDPNKQKMTGFIAQDLYNIFPEAVTTNGDNGTDTLAPGITPWMIDYSKLTPLLVKSVQELDLNLEGVAGIVTPLPGSPSESFVTAFFTNIKTKIGTWLADAGNGITDIFAKKATLDQVCLKDTNGTSCYTRTQLDTLVSGITTPLAGTPPPQGGDVSSPPSEGGVPASSGGGGDSETPTCTFPQTLVNNICTDPVAPAVTLQSIAITTPATKLSYTVADTLDISGLVVTGTYSDATTKIETITETNVSGFDNSTPVTGQVLTITVGEKITTYTIDVIEAVQ